MECFPLLSLILRCRREVLSFLFFRRRGAGCPPKIALRLIDALLSSPPFTAVMENSLFSSPRPPRRAQPLPCHYGGICRSFPAFVRRRDRSRLSPPVRRANGAGWSLLAVQRPFFFFVPLRWMRRPMLFPPGFHLRESLLTRPTHVFPRTADFFT